MKNSLSHESFLSAPLKWFCAAFLGQDIRIITKEGGVNQLQLSQKGCGILSAGKTMLSPRGDKPITQTTLTRVKSDPNSFYKLFLEYKNVRVRTEDSSFFYFTRDGITSTESIILTGINNGIEGLDISDENKKAISLLESMAKHISGEVSQPTASGELPYPYYFAKPVSKEELLSLVARKIALETIKKGGDINPKRLANFVHAAINEIKSFDLTEGKASNEA